MAQECLMQAGAGKTDKRHRMNIRENNIRLFSGRVSLLF